jgi:hypothetical protein
VVYDPNLGEAEPELVYDEMGKPLPVPDKPPPQASVGFGPLPWQVKKKSTHSLSNISLHLNPLQIFFPS